MPFAKRLKNLFKHIVIIYFILDFKDIYCTSQEKKLPNKNSKSTEHIRKSVFGRAYGFKSEQYMRTNRSLNKSNFTSDSVKGKCVNIYDCIMNKRNLKYLINRNCSTKQRNCENEINLFSRYTTENGVTNLEFTKPLKIELKKQNHKLQRTLIYPSGRKIKSKVSDQRFVGYQTYPLYQQNITGKIYSPLEVTTLKELKVNDGLKYLKHENPLSRKEKLTGAATYPFRVDLSNSLYLGKIKRKYIADTKDKRHELTDSLLGAPKTPVSTVESSLEKLKFLNFSKQKHFIPVLRNNEYLKRIQYGLIKEPFAERKIYGVVPSFLNKTRSQHVKNINTENSATRFKNHIDLGQKHPRFKNTVFNTQKTQNYDSPSDFRKNIKKHHKKYGNKRLLEPIHKQNKELKNQHGLGENFLKKHQVPRIKFHLSKELNNSNVTKGQNKAQQVSPKGHSDDNKYFQNSPSTKKKHSTTRRKYFNKRLRLSLNNSDANAERSERRFQAEDQSIVLVKENMFGASLTLASPEHLLKNTTALLKNESILLLNNPANESDVFHDYNIKYTHILADGIFISEKKELNSSGEIRSNMYELSSYQRKIFLLILVNAFVITILALGLICLTSINIPSPEEDELKTGLFFCGPRIITRTSSLIFRSLLKRNNIQAIKNNEYKDHSNFERPHSNTTTSDKSSRNLPAENTKRNQIQKPDDNFQHRSNLKINSNELIEEAERYLLKAPRESSVRRSKSIAHIELKGERHINGRKSDSVIQYSRSKEDSSADSIFLPSLPTIRSESEESNSELAAEDQASNK